MSLELLQFRDPWESTTPVLMVSLEDCYRAYAHDVMAAMLVFQNNETASCCCAKPILWEFNSFLMSALSFVPINLHDCWARQCIRSIGLVDLWFRGARARWSACRVQRARVLRVVKEFMMPFNRSITTVSTLFESQIVTFLWRYLLNLVFTSRFTKFTWTIDKCEENGSKFASNDTFKVAAFLDIFIFGLKLLSACHKNAHLSSLDNKTANCDS